MKRLFESDVDYAHRLENLQREKRYSDALQRMRLSDDWKIIFDEYLSMLIDAKKNQLADLVSVMNPMLQSDIVDKQMVQKQLMILMGIRNFIDGLENEGISISNAMADILKNMKGE